jgi:hypothetical protein
MPSKRFSAEIAFSAETGFPIWIAVASVGRAAMGSKTSKFR